MLEALPNAGPTTFARLTAGVAERLDVIVRFLAVLELFKQGLVDVEQAELFGDITIVWAGVDDEQRLALAVDGYDG